MSEIKFFGKVDRNKDGCVASDLPAWMMRAQLKDLTESIDSKERMLANGIYELSEIPYIKAEIAKEKKRMEEIRGARPKIEGPDKDRLVKMRKDLGKEIEDSMFSYASMMTGEADPHEEAARMSEPCVNIPKELADMCDIPTANGKVNRNEAIRAWRIAGGYLGETINPEALRKDKRGR